MIRLRLWFSWSILEEVFARFMLALSVNDSLNGGVYGIKGLNLTATYSFGASLASVTLTGPKTTAVSAAAGGSASVDRLAYSAAYIKISGGDGKAINVTATLPQYSAVYPIAKNRLNERPWQNNHRFFVNCNTAGGKAGLLPFPLLPWKQSIGVRRSTFY